MRDGFTRSNFRVISSSLRSSQLTFEFPRSCVDKLETHGDFRRRLRRTGGTQQERYTLTETAIWRVVSEAPTDSRGSRHKRFYRPRNSCLFRTLLCRIFSTSQV